MMLYHWAGNLGSALFVYYDTTLGRWVFFGMQVVIVLIVIVWYGRKKSLKLLRSDAADQRTQA